MKLPEANKLKQQFIQSNTNKTAGTVYMMTVPVYYITYDFVCLNWCVSLPNEYAFQPIEKEIKPKL